MSGPVPNGEAVPLTPELQQALAGLHDLQLDVVVGGGSLLPLLVGGSLCSLLAGLALVWARRPRQRYRRRLRQLHQAYRQAGTAGANAPADPLVAARLVAGMASLLRQAALAARMPPGLAGEAWLAWLDARSPAADRGAFVAGVGRELLVWPFVDADRGERGLAPSRAAELVALSERWLRRNA